MGDTYISLTNNLLRRVNEVELDVTSFSSARGMQSLAKDCIQDSIRGINQQRWQWPFHAVQHTQQLVQGQNEYRWPDDFKSVDWESFQIQKDGTYSTSNKHLEPMNRTDWYNYWRDQDDDNAPNGLRTPDMVFRAHGVGFGVTPAPDKPYFIEYRYFKNPPAMVNATDETTIPSEYTNVIIWGGLYHMNLFRENLDGASFAKSQYQEGISNMYNILIENVSEKLTDSRVNLGGSPFFTLTGGYHT